jgi:Arc/MetJ-type ribon-helix-helix transcriptional regulator
MSIQIALRLPEDVVEYIDEQVRVGRARSRSDVVARFVERDRRRERAARDVELMLADRPEVVDEFGALARHAATTALDID